MCQWRKLADLSAHRQLKHKLPRELPGEGAPRKEGAAGPRCGESGGREESCCPGREKLLAPSQAGAQGCAWAKMRGVGGETQTEEDCRM